MAVDTVCARVKIEIKQLLIFGRQVIDAHMRITNGLTDITLENLKVVVSFAKFACSGVGLKFKKNQEELQQRILGG